MSAEKRRMEAYAIGDNLIIC